MSGCQHPPLAEIKQLLLCKECHQSKIEGVLVRAGNRVGLRAEHGHILFLDDAIDPELTNRRVVVTVEVLP